MNPNYSFWYLCGALIFYSISCYREKSLIHLLTPYFLINIAAPLLLDYVYLKNFFFDNEIKNIVPVYNLIIIKWVGLLFGYYCCRKKKPKKKNKLPPVEYPIFISWLLLILAVIIYMVVVIKNYDLINNPRDIYTSTRSGYGLYYYTSIFLLYLSSIFYLFGHKQGFLKNLVYFSILITAISFYGSKSPFITILFIILMYHISVKKQIFGFIHCILISFSLLISLFFVFKITKPDFNLSNSFQNISTYADYNRNAALVVENPRPSSSGKLFLEDMFYSLIPRQILPSKPKNFGSFKLSEYYFPDWFDLDSGSPAFGVGIYIAEFKQYANFIMLLVSFIQGFILRMLIIKQEKKNTVSNFVLVLFFAGISIIQLGVGFQIIPIVALVTTISILEEYYQLKRSKAKNNEQL